MNSLAELSPSDKKIGQKYAILTNTGAGFAIHCLTGPLMLLYCNDALQFSATQIGLIAAIIPLSGLIKLPLLNWLKKFKKLNVLRLAHTGRLLAVIAIILVPEQEQVFAVFLAILLFYLTAFEIGTRSMWQPLMLDITSNDDRGRFFSRMRFIFTLFTTICTAVVPFIVGSDLSADEYKGILIFVAFLLVNQVFWSRKIPELTHDRDNESKPSFKALLAEIKNAKVMGWPLLITFLIQCQSIPLFVIYAKKILFIPTNIVSVYAFLLSFGSLISMLYWGKQNDKRGHVHLLKIMMLLTAVFGPIAIYLDPINADLGALNELSLSNFMQLESTLLLTLAFYLFFGFQKGIILAGGGLGTTALMHYYTPSNQSLSLMPVFLTTVMLGFAFINLVTGWILDYSMKDDLYGFSPFKLWLFFSYVVSPIFVFFLLNRVENSK